MVISTFKRLTQRPSAEKAWQMPGALALPMLPALPCRSTPLEVQATSYLALSAKIVSFCIISTGSRLLRPLGCPPKRVHKTGPAAPRGPFNPNFLPAAGPFKAIGRAQALFFPFSFGGRAAKPSCICHSLKNFAPLISNTFPHTRRPPCRAPLLNGRARRCSPAPPRSSCPGSQPRTRSWAA